MSEFGHVGFIGGGLCIDTWGTGPFVICVDDRSYRFEDSDRFGPSLINRNGDPKARSPREGHPFWRVHRIWERQGRRTEDGINCLCDEPKPQKVRMVGRMAVVIENGEEDGKTIICTSAS